VLAEPAWSVQQWACLEPIDTAQEFIDGNLRPTASLDNESDRRKYRLQCSRRHVQGGRDNYFQA
jgi:hypothetical protein